MFPKVILKDLRDFPIHNANNIQIRKVISLVTQIIELKKQNQPTEHLEAEIDHLVYKLYDLTYEEVLIVDPECTMTVEEYAGVKL